MSRILKYLKSKKGITLVWMALILAVLLMFAGLAIDIAYMYYVKNQLQVAADAAALAGAANLDGTNSTDQTDAREKAVTFAAKNSAAGTPVILASDGSNVLSIDNDITVGNWNPSRPPDDRYRVGEPPINAIQVITRRDETSDTSPRRQVRVFIGQIFRIINADWSFMSARSSAIATMPPRASSFVAVGNQFCPPVGDLDCDPPIGSTYPNTCNLVTPQELFAEPTAVPPDQKIGWTSLLYLPGSTSEFEDLICGTSPYQEICSSPGIWGIPGTSAATFRDYKSLMCDPSFDASSKEINPSGQVTGWEVMIPIVDRTDPMSAPDPNPVIGYAKIHILAVCNPGAPGCRGPGSCISSGFCGPGDNKIVIDRISCISCDTPALGLKPALVK